MRYCLFHAKGYTPMALYQPEKFYPCLDGLFAAAVVSMAEADYQLVPATYFQVPELPLTAGDMILLTDLTYDARVLAGWEAQGVQVKVLDHHKGAGEILSGRFDSIFDSTRSGALITWEFLFPDLDVPEIIKYVSDYDTWQKNLEHVDTVNAVLVDRLEGRDLDSSLRFARNCITNPDCVRDLVMASKAVVEAQQEAIANAASRASVRPINGYDMIYVRCQTNLERRHGSMIAHELLRRYPYIKIAGVQTGRGLSLRSRPNEFDVNTLARMLGGGGHTEAAGCRA
jgi:uncharacterized protein